MKKDYFKGLIIPCESRGLQAKKWPTFPVYHQNVSTRAQESFSGPRCSRVETFCSWTQKRWSAVLMICSLTSYKAVQHEHQVLCAQTRGGGSGALHLHIISFCMNNSVQPTRIFTSSHVSASVSLKSVHVKRASSFKRKVKDSVNSFSYLPKSVTKGMNFPLVWFVSKIPRIVLVHKGKHFSFFWDRMVHVHVLQLWAKSFSGKRYMYRNAIQYSTQTACGPIITGSFPCLPKQLGPSSPMMKRPEGGPRWPLGNHEIFIQDDGHYAQGGEVASTVLSPSSTF